MKSTTIIAALFAVATSAPIPPRALEKREDTDAWHGGWGGQQRFVGGWGRNRSGGGWGGNQFVVGWGGNNFNRFGGGG
jgi:hypothetical protein